MMTVAKNSRTPFSTPLPSTADHAHHRDHPQSILLPRRRDKLPLSYLASVFRTTPRLHPLIRPPRLFIHRQPAKGVYLHLFRRRKMACAGRKKETRTEGMGRVCCWHKTITRSWILSRQHSANESKHRARGF